MKTIFLLFLIIKAVSCDPTVYSSFWAPLFDPTILNYKVDLKFDPNQARNMREEYAERNGLRGETLIANLGNGRGPGMTVDDKSYGNVDFYYTYPGARSKTPESSSNS